MKDLFKKYKFGFDVWGLVLFAVLMLPNIVYWCIPAFNDLGGNSTLDIIATVFEVMGIALLIFVVQKEQKRRYFFDSLYLTASLFVVFYYVAWILYFCGFNQMSIIVFLAVCPCAALLLYEIERKNLPALLPTAVFAVLHVISVLI